MSGAGEPTARLEQLPLGLEVLQPGGDPGERRADRPGEELADHLVDDLVDDLVDRPGAVGLTEPLPGEGAPVAGGPTFRVELRRGSTRRRNVEGVLRDGVFVVSYPPRMALADAERIAQELALRMERRVAADHIDLAARARRLARELDLPEPVSIEWSARQRSLWGTCLPGAGVIRISQRLAEYPRFVLDYVIVHELAHLVAPDHGPRFRALVARYAKAERAIGFLMALDLTRHDD